MGMAYTNNRSTFLWLLESYVKWLHYRNQGALNCTLVRGQQRPLLLAAGRDGDRETPFPLTMCRWNGNPLSFIPGSYDGLCFCSVRLLCKTVSYRHVTAAVFDTPLQEILYLKPNICSVLKQKLQWQNRGCYRTALGGEWATLFTTAWRASLGTFCRTATGHFTLLQSNPGMTRSPHLSSSK